MENFPNTVAATPAVAALVSVYISAALSFTLKRRGLVNTSLSPHTIVL